MSPFDVLGLSHDADGPTIKRAYARLLKLNRPDEDPLGFQRINEAFQACLAHARYVAMAEASATEIEPEKIASEHSGIDQEDLGIAASMAGLNRAAHLNQGSAPHQSAGNDDEILVRDRQQQWLDVEPAPQTADEGIARSEARSFDLSAFVDELLHRDSEDPTVVRAWLVGHEALYSLELKEALVAPLVQQLLERQTRMSVDGLAAVLHFFHLDSVHNGHPWLTEAIEALRYRSFTAAHFDSVVAAHTKGAKSPPRGPGFQSKPIDRLMLRELMGPTDFLRRIFLMLVPLLPTRVIQLLATLRQVDAEYANARINLGAADWWQKVTNLRRFDLRRVALVLARILPTALVVTWLTGDTSGASNLGQRFLASLVWVGGLWLTYALATTARLHAADWQRRHPRVHLRSLSCLALVAAATALGIGIDPVMSLYFFIGATWLLTVDPPMQGRLLALVALVTGTCSYLALASWLGWAEARPGTSFVAALALSFVVVLANDYLFAKEHDLDLAQSRRESGWLKRVIFANVASAIFLIGALSSP